MNIRKTLTTMLVVFVALPLSVSFAATKNRPLKVGDKGWKVKTVQIKLNTLGMKTPKTGRYTRETERQVRAFQQTHHLKVTGKVDDTTYFRINEAAFEKEGIHGIRVKISSRRLPSTKACHTASAVRRRGHSTAPVLCSMYSRNTMRSCRARRIFSISRGSL